MAVMVDDPWRLREALQGDEAAWGAIVDEFAVTIWHWARSFGLGIDDAEDVSQVVWFKLKDQGDTIRDPRRLAGWLAATTKNEALAAKRRFDRTIGFEFDALEASAVIVDDRPGPDDVLLVDETRRRIARAYEGLSAACRELLALCWSGLTTGAIAETIGRPTGSVGPTRQRCLQALRERAGIDD